MAGVGYAAVISTVLVAIYYNVIIAWSLYYLVSSMTSVLPWSFCNDCRCILYNFMQNTTLEQGNASQLNCCKNSSFVCACVSVCVCVRAHARVHKFLFFKKTSLYFLLFSLILTETVQQCFNLLTMLVASVLMITWPFKWYLISRQEKWKSASTRNGERIY